MFVYIKARKLLGLERNGWLSVRRTSQVLPDYLVRLYCLDIPASNWMMDSVVVELTRFRWVEAL